MLRHDVKCLIPNILMHGWQENLELSNSNIDSDEKS